MINYIKDCYWDDCMEPCDRQVSMYCAMHEMMFRANNNGKASLDTHPIRLAFWELRQWPEIQKNLAAASRTEPAG